MARTKDPVRHAGLAKDQVAEAYVLVRDELRRVSREQNELSEQVKDLTQRLHDLRSAGEFLGVDFENLRPEPNYTNAKTGGTQGAGK